MAAVASAYGFVPVNRLGGYEGGSFRQIKMTNSFNTNMFFGDIAIIVAAGTIEDGQAASPTRPIGVFMGCSFTNCSVKCGPRPRLQRTSWLTSPMTRIKSCKPKLTARLPKLIWD